MIGITLHLAGDSEQQAHHAAFTSWLGSHLKNVDSEAHLALEKLSKDNAALDEVIRKASELVASHSDDFTLPLDAASDEQGESEDMYHLLLEQWNHFQNSEAGMGKAIFVEAAKSTTILPNDENSRRWQASQRSPLVHRFILTKTHREPRNFQLLFYYALWRAALQSVPLNWLLVNR